MSHPSQPICYRAFNRDFWIEPASVQTANAVFQDEYRLEPLRPHKVRTIVDIGAHVGSFTVLCHAFWPEAKIVAVEPHPQSFDLLAKNTTHVPKDQLFLIQAAITPETGTTQLSSSVSYSRVGEYATSVWDQLHPRASNFGISVDAITPIELWNRINNFGVEEIDLLKLDCEGAEYIVIQSWTALGILPHIGWIRGEWHSRPHNPLLEEALATTHVLHIDPNDPHEVGLFVAHRR